MVRIILQSLLLLFVARGLDAFAYSCEEVKYKLIDLNIVHDTTYACVFTQEGFSNWKQLNMIQFAGKPWSMDEVSVAQCVSKGANDAPWNVTADSRLTLKCDQEFTFVFTSTDPAIWTPRKSVVRTPVVFDAFPLQIFVVPQTKMWFHTISCTGSGTITFSSGAGVDESENRFALRSWTCATVPKMIYSFDDVASISVDGNVAFIVEHSSDMGSSRKPPIGSLSYGDSLAVLTSGRSDDLQNRKGFTDNRAYINIGKKYDVTVDMEILLDPINTGSVQLQKKSGGRVYDYYTGRTSETFNTDYLEVRYEPSPLQPQQIWNSRDTLLVDVYIGPKPTPAPPAPTTTAPTTVEPTTTSPGTPACQKCSQNLITITTESGHSHGFESDVTDLNGDCAERTMVCLGQSANIEVNYGAGVIMDGYDGVIDGSATLAMTCNQDGTAWLYAGEIITEVECASA